MACLAGMQAISVAGATARVSAAALLVFAVLGVYGDTEIAGGREVIPGRKLNWQDSWRQGLDDCEKKKRPIFEVNGKLVPRKVRQLYGLFAEHMDQQEALEEKKNAAKLPPAPKPKPLTKKEKRKKALSGMMGGSWQHLDRMPQAQDMEAQKMKKYQIESMMGKIFNRSAVELDDEVTLREFCDMVWRTGEMSPLDTNDKDPAPDKATAQARAMKKMNNPDKDDDDDDEL